MKFKVLAALVLAASATGSKCLADEAFSLVIDPLYWQRQPSQ